MEDFDEFNPNRCAEVAVGAFVALLAIGVVKVIAQSLLNWTASRFTRNKQNTLGKGPPSGTGDVPDGDVGAVFETENIFLCVLCYNMGLIPMIN